MLCRASVQPSPVRKVPKRKSPGPPCPGLTVTRSPIFVARISPVTTVVQRDRTKAVGDKNILLHKCHRAGVEPKLVMGFPPRHRFPPNGTPKPRCPPPSPGLHLLKFLGAVKLSCLWSLVNAASPRLSVCDRRKWQPLQRRGKYGLPR